MYRPVAVDSPRWIEEEIVVALDARTGRTIWEYRFPASASGMDFTPGRGTGPHVTPLLAGDRLFAAGTNRQFFALDKRTGKLLWAHDFVREYDAPGNTTRYPVKTGYASSPIAYKDLVIALVGGPQGVIAFQQGDGRIAWRGGPFADVAEASPILIRVGGQPQVVVASNEGLFGLDPDTGATLWGPVANDTQYGVHISTPVWSAHDQTLFFSAAYLGGSKLVRLSRAAAKTDVTELWFTNKLRVHFGTVLRIGGYYYGSSGDFGPGILTAIDAATGQVAWQDRRFAKATLLRADDKAILLSEDGVLALVRLSPAGLTVLANTQVSQTVAWTVPTLVGSTLYVRDRASIMALNVAR